MRPKVIFLILVITEAFLLLICFSPSVGLSKPSIVAVSRYRQDPSSANERVAQQEIARDRRRPLIFASLASLNIIAIVWYAQRFKQPARNQC